ncbi:MAG: DUF4445 domain-containing protein [bacterium]|nr:DUF4445 domain-containing protein [bacterium]
MTKSKDSFSIKLLPDNIIRKARKGTTLFETLESAEIQLVTDCGGDGTCGQCKVKIIKGDFLLHKHIELNKDDIKNNIQLACLTIIENDLEIHIPDSVRLNSYDINKEEKTLTNYKNVLKTIPFTFSNTPLCCKKTLSFDPPTINNNSADLERIKSKLLSETGKKDIHCSLSTIEKIPDAARKSGNTVELHLCEEKNTIDIIDIFGDDKNTPCYGLAVDIGTTTVAVQLINNEDGSIIAEKSEYNQQMSYGADVITRIIFAGKKDGLQKLRKKIVDTVNVLIEDLLSEIAIEQESIHSCSISGNTTMQHLFFGINPKYIREAPYVPAVLNYPKLNGKDTKLHINPHAPVYVTPGIGSYVGGDITSGVLYSGMNSSKKLTLLVDLGTNGEIVLGNSEWMTACACSAGPAFEGSGVKCGMRAVSGAIDKIYYGKEQKEFDYTVLGGNKPEGVCGSAMIDLLAGLYFTGIIDQKGNFLADKNNQRLRKRQKKYEYVIVDGKETAHGKDIILQQTDVDNLIRTKGAIWAGITTLLQAVEIQPSEIERVVVAGTFGHYINCENAILIGMLPDIPAEKFEFIGNASLYGAAMTLISSDFRNEIETISGKITNVELSAYPGYMDEFVASLFIPHTESGQFPSFIQKKKTKSRL